MAIVWPWFRQEILKSPFEKGGFRGILKGYKNPSSPPLGKSGKK
jgi:hypothetical protein